MTNLSTIDLTALRLSGSDLLLLDVGPRADFDEDHIEGAQNVPFASPDFLATVARVAGGRDRRIVVYCGDRTCDAASQAAYRLAGAGHTDVAAYEGGLAAWRERAVGGAVPGTLAANGVASSVGVRTDTPTSDLPPAASPASRKKHFHADVTTLRERARVHIEAGAVTPGYAADRATVIAILNTALATELVCVLRYKRHHFMAQGIDGKGVAAEFLEHADEEQGHADRIAARIVQLGGAPDFSPDGLKSRSHAEYVEGEGLADMLQEDLIAERIAIDSYGAMIRYLGPDDPTTRRMLEDILATEEEHAADLATLLQELTPTRAS